MVHSTLYIINDIQLNLHSPSEYTVAVNFDSANDPLEGLVTYIIPEDKLPKELKKRVNALNLQGYEDGFVHADKNTLESICELFKEYVDLKNIYKDAENNPDAYEMSPNVMFDHLDALKNLPMRSKFSRSQPDSDPTKNMNTDGFFVVIMSVVDKNNNMKRHPVLIRHNTTIQRFLQIIHEEAKKHKVGDHKFWEGVHSNTPDGSVLWILQGS